MSGKNDKTIRRMVKNQARDIFLHTFDEILLQPIKYRLQVAWIIIKGVKKQRGKRESNNKT